MHLSQSFRGGVRGGVILAAIVPNESGSVLEPLASSDVRLDIDYPILGWNLGIRLPAPATQLVECASNDLASHAA
jgi:hypothetical protein